MGGKSETHVLGRTATTLFVTAAAAAVNWRLARVWLADRRHLPGDPTDPGFWAAARAMTARARVDVDQVADTNRRLRVERRRGRTRLVVDGAPDPPR